MPNPDASRNLRKVTPGAEAVAPAPAYPRTVHGPSASSRAKAALALETRAAAAATRGLADLGMTLSAGAVPSDSMPLFGSRQEGGDSGLGATFASALQLCVPCVLTHVPADYGTLNSGQALLL